MNIIFITPSCDDVSKILCEFCHEIIDRIDTTTYPHISFKVLKSEEATLSNLEETLKQVELDNTNIIVFYGHAAKEYLIGWNKISIINNSNINRMKDWHFYVAACFSVTGLGTLAITEGIRSYIGYKDELVIAKEKNKIPKGLKECLNKGIDYVIKKNNFCQIETYKEIMKEYRKWIHYYNSQHKIVFDIALNGTFNLLPYKLKEMDHFNFSATAFSWNMLRLDYLPR